MIISHFIIASILARTVPTSINTILSDISNNDKDIVIDKAKKTLSTYITTIQKFKPIINKEINSKLNILDFRSISTIDNYNWDKLVLDNVLHKRTNKMTLKYAINRINIIESNIQDINNPINLGKDINVYSLYINSRSIELWNTKIKKIDIVPYLLDIKDILNVYTLKSINILKSICRSISDIDLTYHRYDILASALLNSMYAIYFCYISRMTLAHSLTQLIEGEY